MASCYHVGLQLDVMRVDDERMTLTISAFQVSQVLEHPESLLVWLPLTDDVELACGGLTAAQADSPDVVPLFTSPEASRFVQAAQGHSLSSAAVVMTNVVRDQLERGWL